MVWLWLRKRVLSNWRTNCSAEHSSGAKAQFSYQLPLSARLKPCLSKRRVFPQPVKPCPFKTANLRLISGSLTAPRVEDSRSHSCGKRIDVGCKHTVCSSAQLRHAPRVSPLNFPAGFQRPAELQSCAAHISSIQQSVRMFDNLPQLDRSRHAHRNMVFLATVGWNAARDDGCESTWHSLINAAATICAIMKPDESPDLAIGKREDLR